MTTTQKQVGAPPRKRSGIYLTRKRLEILVLIIAALGLGIILWFIFSDSAAESGTKALVEAYSKRRLIEPRLSGGFRASVYDPAPGDPTNIDTAKLDDAKRYFFKAVNNSKDKQAWHAYARMLIAGRQNNKAMALLRPLAADQGASAEIHNDYGACLFEQGKMEDAIDEFGRALEKDPKFREALFNRALCYQRLQLRDGARDDLTRLQDIERDEGWMDESKRRLGEVTRPIQPAKKNAEFIADFKAALEDRNIAQARIIVKESFASVREYAVEYLIKEYSQAIKAQNSNDAARALSRLGVIGNLMLETNGDKEIADLARFVQGLTETDRAENLALMEDCFKQIDAVYAGEYVVSLANFERLQGEFAKRGNAVFQVVSAWMIGRIHYIFNRFNETIKPLEAIAPIAEQGHWTYQMARVTGQIGVSYSRIGQDSLAIKYCLQSLDNCRKVGALEAKAVQYLSLPYWHMGDYDKALGYIGESTALYIAKEPEPSELALNCLQAADIHRVRNRHNLSMLFANQALTFAEESNKEAYASQLSTILSSKTYAAQASSFMAIEQSRLKRFEEADKNMDRAFKYLEEIEAARTRDYNRPLILTRAGDVSAQKGDTEKALKYYEEAETLVVGAQENIIPMIRILRGRTDALIEAGRIAEAQSNLERALNKIENYRSKIVASEQRSYFLDGSQAVFDQAITLSMKAPGNNTEAFNLSERSRARALLEKISDNRPSAESREATNLPVLDRPEIQSRPLGIDEVRNALPDGLAVLEYSVTSQGTYIFLVTRSGFEIARSPATTERLDSLVNTYLSELKNTVSSSEPGITVYLSETARALYGELILPVESKIEGVANLCIIPDKSLHFLPFAALIDEKDQYLVASYNLSYAPSASVLASCIKEHEKQQTMRAEKIVAIGNPSFDTELFPGLKDLPDSATEAREAADVYGGNNSVVLTGALATKSRVVAELKDCDVAHLALHCLVKDDSPWKAALVLAPPKGAPNSQTQAGQTGSLLSLDEMYRVKYTEMKLAVLSACDTALGQYYRGEGIVSLVRPFIASRVPTVLASLWPVESSATRNLMVEFHKERKNRGGRSGEALRTAQMKMASSGPYTHPYYWASFIVIGNSN